MVKKSQHYWQLVGIADYIRIVADLKKTAVVAADRDYGKRVIRVLAVSDLPAEDVVCLVDPTCYVSHLSAISGGD